MRHPFLLSPVAIEAARRRRGNGAVMRLAGDARKPATEREMTRTLYAMDTPLDDISRDWRGSELEE